MTKLNEKDKLRVQTYLKEKLVGYNERVEEDTIELRIDDNDVAHLDISRMYDYFPVNYDTMELLSNLFGSKKIDVDEYYYNGCETCDYGSNYVKQFVIKEVDTDLILKNISVITVMNG